MYKYKSNEMNFKYNLVKNYLDNLLSKEKIHLNYTIGNGRNTKNSANYTQVFYDTLVDIGVKEDTFIYDNDAPRGGFCGDYVQLKTITDFKKKLASYKKKLEKQTKKDNVQKKIDLKKHKEEKKIRDEEHKLYLENIAKKEAEEKVFWEELTKVIDTTIDKNDLENVKKNKKFIFDLYKKNKKNEFVDSLHHFLKYLDFSREAGNVLFEH